MLDMLPEASASAASAASTASMACRRLASAAASAWLLLLVVAAPAATFVPQHLSRIICFHMAAYSFKLLLSTSYAKVLCAMIAIAGHNLAEACALFELPLT